MTAESELGAEFEFLVEEVNAVIDNGPGDVTMSLNIWAVFR
jgi:hypothetical protein